MQRHVAPEDADVAGEAPAQQVLERWSQGHQAVRKRRIATGQSTCDIQQLRVLLSEPPELAGQF